MKGSPVAPALAVVTALGSALWATGDRAGAADAPQGPDSGSIGASQALPWPSDADVLAYRLLQQGRAAEAAEIFTDPAWKGIALYRSDQWWRAAEAFVRADDPVSAYNLGNSYVKLGYYALALDAYLRALSGDPDLSEATHNAELMRQLLAEPSGEQTASGRAPHQDEIEQLAADEEDATAGDGEQAEPAPATPDKERGAPPDEQDDTTSATEQSAEQAGAQSDGQTQEASEPNSDPADTRDVQGREAPAPGERDRIAGGSESDTPSDASREASGVRARLAAEQADEQWLNRIRHDPVQFLDKRIRLEMRRRAAAGQSAPGGGDGW